MVPRMALNSREVRAFPSATVVHRQPKPDISHDARQIRTAISRTQKIANGNKDVCENPTSEIHLLGE
jgi:hypothetical protein